MKKPGAPSTAQEAGLDGLERKRGGRSRPACLRSFRRDGVRLGFLGIGRRRITGAVVVAIGEERRESRRTGFPFAIGLGRLNIGRAQRLGQPARAAQQPLGLLAPCRPS